jgi:hypothetical protein
VFVEIGIVNTHSPFSIFSFLQGLCQPIFVRDFLDKTSGEKPGYFYPNCLLSILHEAVEPLLDGSRLLVKV